jgi:hypothetical protein
MNHSRAFRSGITLSALFLSVSLVGAAQTSAVAATITAHDATVGGIKLHS